jgi:hypothetical protein
VRYCVPAFACGTGGIAIPGMPGIDGAAAAVPCEHGQLQLHPALQQVPASQTEQTKPQHPKTVEAINFNMTKLQIV